ncbi:MAG: AIM24 family protein [Lachnospiraceae bacterium]|nr:AIM24 family protein [Lachnospiraceae bacterium]MBR5179579.1 AIM24 family protein [Lachnospiraceae bacterium]
MVKTNLLEETDSRKIVEKRGRFTVVEYLRDISVSPKMAQEAYFASEMNVRKRQLIADIDPKTGVYAQAGEMQMMIGDVEAATNVKGAGDFLKKLVKSSVTSETIIKPRYTGKGSLVLEPTFYHILLVDLDEWEGDVVIEDGMFLACEDTVDIEVTSRKNVSSLILGGEGIWNTMLAGYGIVALESPVPADELIVVDLEDDVVKIDGSMAVAWSSTLKFTVEKTTSTLVGSLASGEGFVNVYSGTGRVLIAPVRENKGINAPKE